MTFMGTSPRRAQKSPTGEKSSGGAVVRSRTPHPAKDLPEVGVISSGSPGEPKQLTANPIAIPECNQRGAAVNGNRKRGAGRRAEIDMQGSTAIVRHPGVQPRRAGEKSAADVGFPEKARLSCLRRAR